LNSIVAGTAILADIERAIVDVSLASRARITRKAVRKERNNMRGKEHGKNKKHKKNTDQEQR
jgi:hypothetical protein